MLNNHIIPGCPYVKELEWSMRHLVCSAWYVAHLVDTPCPHPIFGNPALLSCDRAHLSRRGLDSLRICYDGILRPKIFGLLLWGLPIHIRKLTLNVISKIIFFYIYPLSSPQIPSLTTLPNHLPQP